MTTNGNHETREDHGSTESAQHGQAAQDAGGHTGEGAASALAHMLSQGQRQRRQLGDLDDAAGRGAGGGE